MWVWSGETQQSRIQPATASTDASNRNGVGVANQKKARLRAVPRQLRFRRMKTVIAVGVLGTSSGASSRSRSSSSSRSSRRSSDSSSGSSSGSGSSSSSSNN